VRLRKHWNGTSDPNRGPHTSVTWEVIWLEPDDGGPGERHAKGHDWADLNADGLGDAILDMGQCGSRGDCVYGVFLGCGQGYFTPVWGPEYAQFVSVGAGRGGWLELAIAERITQGDTDRGVSTCRTFQHGRYQKTVPCGGSGREAPRAMKEQALWKASSRGKSGTGAPILSLDVSGDGKFALSASDSLRLWSTSTGKELRRFGGAAAQVRFAPKGPLAASSQLDGTITLWNYMTGAAVRTLRAPEDDRHLTSPRLAWSANGHFLATAGGSLAIWDVKSGAKLWEKEGIGWPAAIALSADGGLALLGGNDGAVAVLRSRPEESQVLEATWGNHDVGLDMPIIWLDISPDHTRVLAVHQQGRVTLWHLPTGKEIAFFGYSLDSSLKADVSRDWGLFVGTAGSEGAGLSVSQLHWPSPALDQRLTDEDFLIDDSGDVRESYPLGEGKVEFEGTGEVALMPDGRHVLMGDAEGNIHRLSLPPPPARKRNQAPR
jgi:hypothetical protein